MISPLDTTILYLKFFRVHCHIRAWPRQICVAPYRRTIVMIKINIVADQLEYTAPTGFRFLDEPMFCFSTLNANTNPNPNCRPGHRPWPLTPWQSLPGHRPWLLTAINRVNGQGRCPGRLCHGVSGQGRCPGRQLELGLGFVLAFRVEKQNIGSSRN